MILRARILLPMSQPPLENGALVVAGDRIQAVGRWDSLASTGAEEVVDLGEVALLPGWVNAHCHLDYTDMAGQIAPPRSFADWVKAITSLKSMWSNDDYHDSWLHGAQMLVQTGTTTVANIETIPDLLPGVSGQTPLRLFSFLELIGIRNVPSPAELLRQALERLPPAIVQSRWLGLSPHAPYSTTPDLLRYSVGFARQNHWRTCTHVAESEQEFDMFMYNRGPMFEWLKSQRAMADCGHGSPVQHLERLGVLGEDLLAVHVNYLWHEDARLLGDRRVSVAHCARSHAYFQHQAFRHTTLGGAGVNLCLGTDSLATVKPTPGQPLELNMFAELQAFADTTSIVSPETMVRMATANGAHALGLDGQVGELTPRAWADVIAVPYLGGLEAVFDGVVNHRGPVVASMIGGRWAVPPSNN